MSGAPIIVDLYSGVGGLSLGAARAGFRVAAAVELDRIALDTHAENFPNSAHISADVSTLSASHLLKEIKVKSGAISGVIGGPPCQGFSTMGRGDPNDPRNSLFIDFFRMVRDLKPAFFVAENVPGIMSPKYAAVREAAFSLVRNSYRLLPPITVVANEYGAPTTRKRIFFIGYQPKYFKEELSASHFAPKNVVPTNVRSALSGLPRDVDENSQDFKSGCRKLGKLATSEFHEQLVDRIPIGVGSAKAIKLLLEKEIVTGCLGTRHTPQVIKRFNKLQPGQQDLISKAIRLNPTGFCPTLRAGTASDRGSFQSLRPVHYLRPRVITPREGARLQGFPDWFIFHPTKWHSFRQIGNSVSPIVAEAILSELFCLLN